MKLRLDLKQLAVKNTSSKRQIELSLISYFAYFSTYHAYYPLPTYASPFSLPLGTSLTLASLINCFVTRFTSVELDL